jgi:hypothetical protein
MSKQRDNRYSRNAFRIGIRVEHSFWTYVSCFCSLENTMKKQFFKMGMAVCAGVLLTQVAWAQPDLNEAPKADNPPENNRPRRNMQMNMEERRKAMEDRMREMLVHVGVNEAATQDAILAYVQTDLEARRPMREQTTKLFKALNGGVTDAQLLALVTDYRAAQEAEKARRETALQELDAKIHYTQNPRLEAILLLAGLLGDGQGNMMLMGGGGRGGNGFGGQGGQGMQGNNAQRREQMQQRMLQRFDKNNDGKLDADEQAAAQQWRQERRQNRNNAQPNGNAANDDAPDDAKPEVAEMPGA